MQAAVPGAVALVLQKKKKKVKMVTGKAPGPSRDPLSKKRFLSLVLRATVAVRRVFNEKTSAKGAGQMSCKTLPDEQSSIFATVSQLRNTRRRQLN